MLADASRNGTRSTPRDPAVEAILLTFAELVSRVRRMLAWNATWGFTLFKILVVPCGCSATAVVACGPEEGEKNCGAVTKFGDPVCCGRSGEVPGVSCIDSRNGGSVYGLHGRCYERGEQMDQKFVGSVCCEGLTITSIEEEVPSSAVADAGITCSFVPPSAGVCTPCGNGVCEEGMENRCRCSEDCDR